MAAAADELDRLRLEVHGMQVEVSCRASCPFLFLLGLLPL